MTLFFPAWTRKKGRRKMSNAFENCSTTSTSSASRWRKESRVFYTQNARKKGNEMRDVPARTERRRGRLRGCGRNRGALGNRAPREAPTVLLFGLLERVLLAVERILQDATASAVNLLDSGSVNNAQTFDAERAAFFCAEEQGEEEEDWSVESFFFSSTPYALSSRLFWLLRILFLHLQSQRQ